MCNKNTAIETVEQGLFKLEIFQDMDPESPLTWGWPVKLLQTRHSLEREDLRTIIEEHGNIWYSQVPTQDRGYTYIIAHKREWLRAMAKGATDAAYHGWNPIKKRMQDMCDSMASIYAQYVEGDIYGYVVSIDGEEKESVWGFYGIDEVMKEGKSALQDFAKQEQEAQQFEAGAMAL